MRGAADVVVAADQIPRREQEIDEVDPPCLDLQPAVALDGLAQLLLQERRQVGVGHLRELLQHVHDLLVLVEHVGAGDAVAIPGSAPPPRIREVSVRGQFDDLRLDPVVVAAARPDGVGGPDRLREGARRLRGEKEAVAAAVGRLVGQLGELVEVGR